VYSVTLVLIRRGNAFHLTYFQTAQIIKAPRGFPTIRDKMTGKHRLYIIEWMKPLKSLWIVKEVLKPGVLNLTFIMMAFLEPEVTIFRRDGAAGEGSLKAAWTKGALV